MDESAEEYTFTEILIKIRNGLLHYKPKWDYEKTPEEEMESQLSQLKRIITFSPFISENAPLFPMRCMSLSFAKWTITTTLDFIKWYEDTAGLGNRFEQYREGLVLETQ